MILVDTSIWIDFFRQDQSTVKLLEEKLKHQEVAVIEPVFSELLYGARTKRDKQLILSYWQLLPKIPFGEGSMMRAAIYANEHNFHNLGVGLMDATIIEPVVTQGIKLWTLDKRIIKAIEKKYLLT